MRAWPLKTHRQHPASRTVHSACEVAATPGGTGKALHGGLLQATGGLPTARLQRAVTRIRARAFPAYTTLHAKGDLNSIMPRNDLT